MPAVDPVRIARRHPSIAALVAASMCAWPATLPAQGTGGAPLVSADTLLRRAIQNLEGPPVAARVAAVRVAPDGTTTRRTFRMFRRRTPEGLFTLVAGFAGDAALDGVRLLQLDALDPSATRAFIYSSEIGPAPRPTPYRLIDPFLGRAMLEENSLATPRVPGVDFEVLGRAPATLQGEKVERIRVRPLRAADHDAAELWIAPSDAAILESRYYVNGEAEPIRVLQTPRASMLRIGTYLLPEKMTYIERGTKTLLELSYTVLTDTSAALFDPERFHVQPLDSVESDQPEVQ